jgi:long-chain acyl-CoA synthetase
METIRQRIRSFIVEDILASADAAGFTDDTNLRECGILDSFSALKLVSFIEDKFEVQLEAEDFEAGKLFAITSLESLVLSKRPTGLYELFASAAALHADRVAIVGSGATLTYRELLGRVDAFSASLHADGARSGQKAAVVLGNNPSFLVAVLAAWKLGLTVIPLDPALKAQELLRALQDSRPEILIVSPAKEQLCISLESRVRLLSPTAEEASAGARVDEIDRPFLRPDCPALTQYSTGSTGTPKRVTRTHGQLTGEFRSIATVLPLSPDDRVLGVVPFFHSHGLKNAVLLPLFAGAALYAIETFFPRHVARLIADEKITVVPGVPFMFQQLAELRNAPALPSLRLAFSGSAPLPVRTARAFEGAYGLRIRRVYGTTETGLISVERAVGVLDDLNRAGQPLPGVQVEIVDEAGEPVAAGTKGHVKVTSPFAPSQYDRSNVGSASYFRDGSYFPGDVGFLTDDGELVLLGRCKGFINVGGNKVDATEVEAALLQLPGVTEAAVVGIPDELYGERVKAVIVSAHDLTQNDVRTHLMGRLAEFKHPREIEFRKEIPRTAMGKVQKRSLIEGS